MLEEIMCEPCNGKGWSLCIFFVKDKKRIHRRCPACRAVRIPHFQIPIQLVHFTLFYRFAQGLMLLRYIFLVTLLSIPESSFSIAFKMFDVQNHEEIDKEEFKKVMAFMRANNRQGQSRGMDFALG